MHWIVSIGEMRTSKQEEDTITAFGLGSCLGIILYDPMAKIGGLVHCLLPTCKQCQGMAETSNLKMLTFIDQGVPMLLRQVCADGAKMERLRVYVGGGASFSNDANDLFSIGIRNFVSVCASLRKLRLPITGKEVGGKLARTLNLHVGTGRVWINTGKEEREL